MNNFIQRYGKIIKEMTTIHEEEWIENSKEEQLYLSTLNEVKRVLIKDVEKDRIDPSLIKKKNFDIILAYFPFNDNNTETGFRPVIVIEYEENKFKYMMLTSGEKTDIIYRLYEIYIDDYKPCGLNKKCFIRVNRVREEKDVIITNKSRIIGHITEKYQIEIGKMLERYASEVFTNPIPFLDWLIYHKVTDTQHERGNNNYCSIQTVDDIKNSFEANCVDIAIVTYKMAKMTKDIPQATIGNVKWIINSRKSDGHVFMVFKYKGKSYVFDYDQVQCLGQFRYYRANFENVVKWFSNDIKKEHPDEEIRRLPPNRVRVKMLNEEELKTLDDTSKYETQKDWLIEVGFYKPQDYGEIDKQGLKEFYKILKKKDPIYYALMEWCCQ